MAKKQTRNDAANLVVPEMLQGEWTSMVILTYGASIGFFESRLLRQLAQVPTRLVLADQLSLQGTLDRAGSSGQRLAQLNRTYVIAPIRHPRAAHAKAILLTNETAGRLLIGSGNLGQDGYATPGELWHVWEYGDADPQHLPCFSAFRHLVDGLSRRSLTDAPVNELLDQVWSDASWITDAIDASSPVRHNLDQALIEQLAAAAPHKVKELTVYAPFHDADCAALSELINRLSPARVHVLLSEATSIRASALGKILLPLGKRGRVSMVRVANDPSTYIHAKWVHVVGVSSELLLTGSANLSRAALLRSSDQGNIELGVLQTRGAGEFADLYAPLRLTAVSDIDGLKLKFHKPPPTPEPAEAPRLLWAQLEGDRLSLHFDRPVNGDSVRVRGFEGGWFNLTHVRTVDGPVTIKLAHADWPEVTAGGPMSVSILTADGSEVDAGTIWPYHVDALRDRLGRAAGREALKAVGKIPEADEEVYALLQQLEQSLIFDIRSAWRTAHPAAKPADDEPESQSGRWADIDWDRVRRSGRYSSYHYRTRAALAPTDIQLILTSISRQLHDAVGSAPAAPVLTTATEDDSELGATSREQASSSIDDEEEEPDWDEIERRHVPLSTRTRQAFGRFIDRYAEALGRQDFLDALGKTVAAHNAAIFNHLLFQLIQRDAVDLGKGIRALLATWRLLWGANGNDGLVATLQGDEEEAIPPVLAEAKARETALRALAYLAEFELERDLLAGLRSATHFLLTEPSFGFGEELVRSAAPSRTAAQALLDGLRWSGSSYTRAQVATEMARCLGLPAQEAQWTEVRVMRPPRRSESPESCLEVFAPVEALTSKRVEQALGELFIWCSLAHMDLDYYRLRFHGNGVSVGVWDHAERRGFCLVRGEEETEIRAIAPPWPHWWRALDSVEQSLGVTQKAS